MLKIVNPSGQTVVSFTYDAWGNFTLTPNSEADRTEITFAAAFNPIFYRGYLFDYETGLYYLQSRYYNPEMGRFINADDKNTGYVLGTNLYCYSYNSPVMLYDPYGDEPIESLKRIIVFSIAYLTAYGFQYGRWLIPKFPPLVYNNVIDSSYKIKNFKINQATATALKVAAKVGEMALALAINKYLSSFIATITKTITAIVISDNVAEVVLDEIMDGLLSFKLFSNVSTGTYCYYISVFIEENPENTAQLVYSYCLLFCGPLKSSLKIRIFGNSLEEG